MGNIIAKPFALLLSLFYSLTGHYWLAIVVLSVFVRGAMYPIYKKQILSTAGMTDLQPKINQIQQKYANDKQMMNQKIAELYKEEGVNPTSGCLPMIVQLIVISGLFVLLRYPLNYLSDDMVFAVHESFLWIRDLSQPDPWILPIMSGVATFFAYTMSTSNNINSTGGSQGGMKAMSYIFPILIVWLSRSYPAGLAIYWFISQFMQIFFNIRYNQIRKEMKAKKEYEARKGKVGFEV